MVSLFDVSKTFPARKGGGSVAALRAVNLQVPACAILRVIGKSGVGKTIADIIDNPKSIRIVEIDAAQTPRSLQDVDAAAINTNYAVEAGLEPTDAILREDPKGPYVNLIAVREQDKDAPWVAALVEAYQTPEVREFVESAFKGAVLPSW